jgi:serine/threonine protein kinase
MNTIGSPDPLMGRMLLGRYRIVRTLARGGMGVVYLGRVEGAAGFAKPVVVKTVIPQLSGDSRLEEMFVREAQIVSNLLHPGIVGVIDFGEVDGAYMMVLEYVHGFHLGQWARYVASARGQMPVTQAVHIVAEVLDALQYAHTLTRPDGTPLRIVHRDVSPPNILLDVQARIRLHDFGVARMANEVGEYKTQDGGFRGTLSYAAPETVQGAPASVQSDLYSCGIVLHQLLVGTNPIKGQDPNETMFRVLHHVPPSVRSLREDVPEAISAAIDRAIAKDPIDRFESAAAFADALRAGRTWDAVQASNDFAAVIERDFTGEMAEQLGLVPLEVRDAAWRDSLRDSTVPPTSLDSSPPRLSSSPPRIRYSDSPVAAGPSGGDITVSDPNYVARRTAALKAARRDEGAPPTEPKRRPAVLLVAVAAGVLAVAGVVLFLGTRDRATPDRHFVMIERQAGASGDSPPLVPPSATPSAFLPAGPAESARPVDTRAAEPPSAARTSDAQRLSHAFQRQQGKIESCFRSHEGEPAQSPQVSIRFQIDSGGKVTSAQVLPASMAGSGLGSCIAGVAKSTDFGPQANPIAFTIPITARRLAN